MVPKSKTVPVRTVLFLAQFVCMAAWGQQPTLTGRVMDSSGVGLGGALVYIHWDSSGSDVGLATNVGTKENIVASTDAAGGFEVALPPGFYDVFVASASFSPECRKIRVLPGRAATYTVRLKFDPLVGKEIGDRIPAR
jgi:hypothetical protein